MYSLTKATEILIKHYQKWTQDVENEIIKYNTHKLRHSNWVLEVWRNLIIKIINNNDNIIISSETINRIEIILLLHDIARFHQNNKKRILNNIEFEHWDEWYKILKEENYDEKICLTVKYHNKFNLNDLFKEETYIEMTNDDKNETLFLSKFIRDADKLQNMIYEIFNIKWLIKLNHKIKPWNISFSVLDDLNKKITINKNNIITHADYIVWILSWIYDINFEESIDMLNYYSFFEKIIVELSKLEWVTKENIEVVKQNILNYKLNNMKKIYVIWIGWIWISWIARYYKENWYQVYWSDKNWSELINTLKKEWIDIIIWENENRINESFEKIIYTEAITKNQIELQKAMKLWIEILTYPEALAEIANRKKLITITWTHWKTTTTSMISIILKNSLENVNALVWSLLKEFNGKNVYFSNSKYFVLEACEYKRSFLAYKSYIWVITNIDLDHLDYYKDLSDYISAFEEYINNIVSWWYVIFNWNCKNSLSLLNKRKDINYIIVYYDKYILNWKEYYFPDLNIKIPGDHIKFDAKLAFVVWKIIWIQDKEIKNTLKKYNWIWRRSEFIWKTLNNNILISDYWHHPTEISLNLKALKDKYQYSYLDSFSLEKWEYRKILTIFQPHQYNRTLKFLENFKNCFLDTDILIISDIYESRDNDEDKAKINDKKFLDYINHKHKILWNWLKNTLNLIKKFDNENPWKLIIILQWAWNIDDLRYEIKTK